MPVINLYGLTITEAQERLASIPGITFLPICQDCLTSADSLSARIGSQTPEYIVIYLILHESTLLDTLLDT